MKIENACRFGPQFVSENLWLLVVEMTPTPLLHSLTF